MWWLTIVLDCVVTAVATLICFAYFRRTYGAEGGMELLNQLRKYESTHGKMYAVFVNFRNFWSNILLKCIFTLGCILLIHFTQTMWITIFYVALLAFSIYTYVGRCVHFRKLSEEDRVYARPAQRMAVVVPVCHLIFCGSLYLTYILQMWHPAA